MVPAIWTGMRFPSSAPEALRFLHSCGWEWFELSTEHLEQIEADADPQARVEEALQTLDELKVTMPQAHAYLPANVAHPDSFRRDADMNRLTKHLDLCAALRVKYVVIHPGTGDGYTTPQQLREVRQLNLDNFARLADHAGALGLKIGLENMMDDRKRNRRNFGARPTELIELLASLDHPALGITIDTSHTNVQKLDAGAVIGQFGPHICCTHMSDNDGSGDQHRAPGGGTVNWPGVVAALREMHYEGVFNLEIPGESEPAPDEETLAARTREALAVTRRLLAG
jgi:sugar phosphate isomerase/epimerase